MSISCNDYYRPSQFEISTSWVHGLVAANRRLPSKNRPRTALDDVLRPFLVDGPCFIGFSGGRDSSALLAAATALARHEGFADPVPVTEHYPDVPAAYEENWQHLVIDHLRLQNWERLSVGDESDLVGDTAQNGLRTRGVIWPPAVQILPNLLSTLDPGWYLTGEGGDEVFGPRRTTRLRVLPLRRGQARASVRTSVAAVLPRPIRELRIAAALRRAVPQPWLRPNIAAQHRRLVASDLAAEPLRWSASILWLERRRAAAMGAHNARAVAAECRMRLVEPFLDAHFLTALAREGGPLGYADRTEFMKSLFSDVLPAVVLERRTKASFDGAYLRGPTREFARSWNGCGVDDEMVDAERLRQEWLAERPSALSTSLLQSAWLASQSGGDPA